MEKQPNMPDSFRNKGVLPLKVLYNQINTRSEFIEFQFIKEVLTKSSVRNCGGYNTK